MSLDVDRLKERVLRQDGAAAEAVREVRVVGQRADGQGSAHVDVAGQPDAAKRRGRDPRRDGLVTALNFLRAGIAAIMPENAGGVGQPVLEVASVNHAADVSPRIDVVCPEGAIHEVVVRDARELVEAEWDLELAHLDLRLLHVLDVHIHVFPLRLGRIAQQDILVAELLLGQLALDLVVDFLEEVAFDADAIAMQLKQARGWKDLVRAVEARRAMIRSVRIFLEPRLEIETERVADSD